MNKLTAENKQLMGEISDLNDLLNYETSKNKNLKINESNQNILIDNLTCENLELTYKVTKYLTSTSYI